MISKIISHTISTPSGSESESESFLENEDQNWLTCAGELSYLVEDLKNASDLIDKAKSDTCPAVETFLVNVEKITQRICKNASIGVWGGGQGGHVPPPPPVRPETLISRAIST